MDGLQAVSFGLGLWDTISQLRPTLLNYAVNKKCPYQRDISKLLN